MLFIIINQQITSMKQGMKDEKVVLIVTTSEWLVTN